jgi:hypothetical protein
MRGPDAALSSHPNLITSDRAVHSERDLAAEARPLGEYMRLSAG